MICVQMEVQVLPVDTAITLVCRYVVRYHGEWFDICLCSDSTYLREQRREQGAKRTVVVMLQVSTCVNEIKWF